jgi:hypothetical protein
MAAMFIGVGFVIYLSQVATIFVVILNMRLAIVGRERLW